MLPTGFGSELLFTSLYILHEKQLSTSNIPGGHGVSRKLSGRGLFVSYSPYLGIVSGFQDFP